MALEQAERKPLGGARQPRPETPAKMDARRIILEVSARLFAENGYKGTNLKLVANELQVTRQALYYHFQSKSDILGGLFDKMMTALEDAAVAAPPVHGEPRIVSLLRAHALVIAENPDLVSVLLHERPEMSKLDELGAAGRRQRYTQQFVEAYEEGKRDGALPDIDAQLAVNTLIAATNGIASWYHPGRHKMAADVVAQGVLKLLIAGLNPRPKRRGAAVKG